MTDDKYTAKHWQDKAISNGDDPVWFTACATMAQALAAERQAAALERIAKAQEQLANISQMGWDDYWHQRAREEV